MLQNGDYGFVASFPQVYTGRPIPHYHIMVCLHLENILSSSRPFSFFVISRSPPGGARASPSSPRSTSGARSLKGSRTMSSPEALSTEESPGPSQAALCPTGVGPSTLPSGSTLTMKLFWTVYWSGGSFPLFRSM